MNEKNEVARRHLHPLFIASAIGTSSRNSGPPRQKADVARKLKFQEINMLMLEAACAAK